MQRHGATNTLRTRREFIGGSGAPQEDHIASILVQAWPERLDSVERALTQLPGVESHGSDGAGKLILTVETGSDADLLARIREIETADGVIAATLVYHHAEEMVDEG